MQYNLGELGIGFRAVGFWEYFVYPLRHVDVVGDTASDVPQLDFSVVGPVYARIKNKRGDVLQAKQPCLCA